MDFQDDKKQKDFLRKYRDANRKMEEDETAAQALQAGLPYIDLSHFPVDLNALAVLPKQQAQDAEAVVFYKEGNDLRIGTNNPTNGLQQNILKNFQEHNLKPSIYFISKSSFAQLLAMYEKVLGVAQAESDEIALSSAQKYSNQLASLSDEYGTLTASQVISILIGGASEYKASDVHIEPEENFIKIRYRLDGVLVDVSHLAKHYQKPLIARIKILSKLKLNVENVPQDGRFSYTMDGQPVDVRVSVLPSAYGEGTVLRILGTSAVSLKLNDLGLSGKAYEQVERELQKPNGMVVTTGPTGSGKTTSLYAFLNQLNEPGVKIITLEDPVEYKLEGVNQTPIGNGMTFASGLRAILRQDPDVIMVGEIRDQETAETALQAALTGHVVLSTLHTNDAAGAIPRLINMGVKPFVIAPALNAIIAQRLVRRLCPDCKKEIQLDSAMLASVRKSLQAIPSASGLQLPPEDHWKFYHSTGCAACNNLGYRGRIGIYEVIEKSDQLDKLIMAGASTSEIKEYAVKAGMITMMQDGLLKAMQGITDVQEVFRVTQE